MEGRMTGVPLIPPTVERLVIHLPSWVGDIVMATPALRAARRGCPQARIIGLMRRGTSALLAGCADVDDLIAVDSPGVRGVLASARAIRRARADAGLLLPNSFRSALAMRLGGVPIRVGYARDHRSWLLSAPVAPGRRDQPIPAVDYYLTLAEVAFGRSIEDRVPVLTIADAEREEADRLLGGAADPIVVLNPGANRASKRWPAERFAAVARALAAEARAAIAVTGSPGERALTAKLASECGNGAIDLAAMGVTLGVLKAVLRRAALLITNDTGPRHIAAAVGTPAVVLFGPTDHRWTTLPHARERLLLAEPFLPEDLLADDHARACAIERIPVSDVLNAARDLLAAPHSAHAAHPQ